MSGNKEYYIPENDLGCIIRIIPSTLLITVAGVTIKGPNTQIEIGKLRTVLDQTEGTGCIEIVGETRVIEVKANSRAVIYPPDIPVY